MRYHYRHPHAQEPASYREGQKDLFIDRSQWNCKCKICTEPNVATNCLMLILGLLMNIKSVKKTVMYFYTTFYVLVFIHHSRFYEKI